MKTVAIILFTFIATQSSGFKTLPEGAHVLFKEAKEQKGPQTEEVEFI